MLDMYSSTHAHELRTLTMVRMALLRAGRDPQATLAQVRTIMTEAGFLDVASPSAFTCHAGVIIPASNRED